jgi:hypothetical protein
VRTKVRASESLMRHYYWAAKAVTQLNQILLLNIEERLNPITLAPRPINAHFLDKSGLIEVVSDDLYQREPHAILETFLVYQTTDGAKGLSARTLRALYNARVLMTAKFRNDPVNRATFMQILQQPRGITHAMRLMNQYVGTRARTSGSSAVSSARCSTICSTSTPWTSTSSWCYATCGAFSWLSMPTSTRYARSSPQAGTSLGSFTLARSSMTLPRAAAVTIPTSGPWKCAPLRAPARRLPRGRAI